MLNGPFSPWPCYTDEEKQAVLSVLDSNRVNYWTGNEARKFEQEFARYCKTEHAIALANGTVALDLCFSVLNLPRGSEVIVTSRTFIASVSSIVLSGLVPVFADISPDSQNISAQTIAPLITKNTAAILCVHLAGWPCEMDEINVLARQHDLYVVEDCAQAHGASYKGKPVGGLGHIAAWSFCQDKIMTTAGEGGMLTTNDTQLWEKAWAFKDHGKSYQSVYEKSHPPGFRWLHESFGTNWRMTEIQSTVGRIQLRRMPDWHQQRENNAHCLQSVAASLPGLRVPSIPRHIQHAWYKCYVFVEPEKLAPDWNRDRIISRLNEMGVPCFSGSCSEVYREKAFDNTTWRPAQPLKYASELGSTSLMFLVHPGITQAEIEKSCESLAQVMSEAVL
ncbi:DegT/DnrJ/EryC1/StrS family aminotransferase [Lacimicrobium alkaliphilum]|uniref:Aminotransferase n=1 Tax=Lacimicrobium alkaliphilum TaxID=1526571 RepID=A0ABQ1R3Y8_9ALTE|nr:DegT/DnrJ/EryC1/StrS aminotransferase family protein [Lacimicrobium alkaliphilum]GGD54180.1 aminotransferase [Lacimicrobium alkaliphilum]